ncbi:SDR family oxidoreductase [Streptomyces sp. MNU77]|uniref:SDR family oxidoreductase n=1 Tax=Streptomyces sp. MNU77 TaxID=1573406 RepID=UPI0005E92AFD|nr:SDR family oxidoreductase [Streptomyces sp. MNU77]OLO25826.1 SDR family oxidoreductase [Streptomyces sp. MNU77]
MTGTDFSYQGRTALVTGASRNIGRSIALALAARGIAVGVNARRDAEGAEKTRAEIVARGGRAVVALGDVGDPVECGRIADTVTAALGPVDYLISNASVRRFQAFTEITPEQWDGVLRSNLSALFYLSRLVLPGMKERGFGRVVAIGGPDGYTGWHHRAHNVTAKAGLAGLVKAVSFEFGHFGVTANVVVPGGTDTTRDAADYPPDMTERPGVPKGRPLVMIPRLGTPGEIADACAFLCSDQAAYITGQSLHVDGGLVMR